jgi:hypothetical protein
MVSSMTLATVGMISTSSRKIRSTALPQRSTLAHWSRVALDSRCQESVVLASVGLSSFKLSSSTDPLKKNVLALQSHSLQSTLDFRNPLCPDADSTGRGQLCRLPQYSREFAVTVQRRESACCCRRHLQYLFERLPCYRCLQS